MRYCKRCVLPETFPGADLDEEGICRYCRNEPQPETTAAARAQLRARFDALVDEIRPTPGYHALMSWSGGKDSTYTLWLLKARYNLRVTAFTFDNGFISDVAFRNMRTVAEALKIDHTVIKPDFALLRRLFVASLDGGLYTPRALERASGICLTCMSIAKGLSLRLALSQHIPLMVYGWSPGQIPLSSALYHSTPQMMKAMLRALRKPLDTIGNGQIAAYFPDEDNLEQPPPYNISPLAFLDYNEEEAFEQIRGLGWERPQDTDPNSTNCLLNAFANTIHQNTYHYHPYCMEIAGLVRQGYLDRAEGLRRLETASSPIVTAAVKAKLGLEPQEHAS